MAQTGSFSAIHIAAEATGTYWLTFFCQLEQSPDLAAYPLTLYPFNPKVIHNSRKSFGDWDKTDDLDTAVITERLRFCRKLLLPLRTLTRYRTHLIGELVQVKSFTLSLVYLQASEYTVRQHLWPHQSSRSQGISVVGNHRCHVFYRFFIQAPLG